MDFDQSLRVAAPDIGGGFGAKLCVYSEDVAVVAAAKLLEPLDEMDRGPARVFHQRGARARPVLGAGDRGRRARRKVLGVRGKLLHDTGAYTLQDPNIPYNSASTMSGPYVDAGARRSTSPSP